MLGLSYASSLSPRSESELATLFTPSPSRVGHPGDPYKGFSCKRIEEHKQERVNMQSEIADVYEASIKMGFNL